MTPRKTLLEEKPDWRMWAKGVAMAAVVAAGVVKPNLPPGSAGHVVCEVVIAVGAAFGIASAGLSRGR